MAMRKNWLSTRVEVQDSKAKLEDCRTTENQGVKVQNNFEIFYFLSDSKDRKLDFINSQTIYNLGLGSYQQSC